MSLVSSSFGMSTERQTRIEGLHVPRFFPSTQAETPKEVVIW